MYDSLYIAFGKAFQAGGALQTEFSSHSMLPWALSSPLGPDPCVNNNPQYIAWPEKWVESYVSNWLHQFIPLLCGLGLHQKTQKKNWIYI